MVEKQAICYILEKGINGFKSNFFVDCKTHFDFIEGFYRKYNQLPDQITFLSKFGDFKLFKVSEPKEAVLFRLKEEVFAKKLIPIYNKCSEMIEAGNSIEAASLLSDSISRLKSELSNSASGTNITNYEWQVDEYQKILHNQIFYSTGFKQLDDLLGGWSKREDLVVLFARLGIGKSWVATFFAYILVKNGLRVGFYAGEMDPYKLSLRMNSFHTNTSNFALNMGHVNLDEYKNLAKGLSSLPGEFIVLTPKDLGGAASVSDIANFIENEKLDCMFVDQISLIKRDGKKSTHDNFSQIANEFRVLQSVMEIPIFLLAQQNRSSLQDGDPGAEHIAYADDIGQNATIAIALSYDKDSRILTLHITKSRNSSTGKYKYVWNIDRGTFDFIPDEEATGNTEDTTEYQDKGGSVF